MVFSCAKQSNSHELNRRAVASRAASDDIRMHETLIAKTAQHAIVGWNGVRKLAHEPNTAAFPSAQAPQVLWHASLMDDSHS
jgi:hypothetical protein